MSTFISVTDTLVLFQHAMRRRPFPQRSRPMSRFLIRDALLVSYCVIALLIAGCGSEAPEAMLKRALSDKSMPDSKAVELIAKASFKGTEVSTVPAADGKVVATISIHGVDESRMPPSVIDTAQGGVNNAMKQANLMMFLRDFAEFIEHARQRNLNEVVLTIKTPTFSEGKIQNWVDTYRLRLSADKFDKILQLKQLDLKDQNAAAERIWTIEHDGFGQFSYQK